MKYKVGDIVKSNQIFRLDKFKCYLEKIVLDEHIHFEIVKCQKSPTFIASYVVKNIQTNKIEKYQYWEADLELA
tara:strand:- start:2295 stop:2516 length:222 start_codon:yes stop_codon:yes gene_type:complete